MKKLVMIFLAIVCVACSQRSTPTHQSFCVGIDPSFFPAELGNQHGNVHAFMQELFQFIAKKEATTISLVPLSWDNLFDEMALGRVDGVISSAPPNLINTLKYEFSDPLLRTGPVLVVPKQAPVTSLADLKNQVVTIQQGNDEIALIAQYPQTIFNFYHRYASALQLVSEGNLQGALIPIIPAARFVEDLFSNQLKIVTPPLTNQALRLLTPLPSQSPRKNSTCQEDDPQLIARRQALIKLVNTNLDHMLNSGEYQNLLHQWNLSQ